MQGEKIHNKKEHSKGPRIERLIISGYSKLCGEIGMRTIKYIQKSKEDVQQGVSG